MQVEISKTDLETLRSIFRRFPSIRSVRVFGSRATGSARRTSDIDIAVSAPDMMDREWVDLREALDAARIIYDLDLIRFETLLNDKLRARIDSDGILIYPQ